MNRSSLFVAAFTVLLVGVLIGFAPPLVAQEKPADPAGKKDLAAGSKAGKKLSAAGQEVDSGIAAPRIHFPEPLHDFGTIARGSKVVHDFRVLNRGDAPLKLIKAKGS